MGLIFSIWRRYFGGYDSKWDIIESRGIQCAFLIILAFCWEYFVKGETIIVSSLTAFFLYMFFCKSHYYYFLCGTESDEYIDQQEANGREPAMNGLVAPVNKWLGFKPRSRQYCFIGMLLRYTLWSIPVALFVGWQFILAGLSIAFVYNACFWIEFPECKLAKSPTNWAELISGFIAGWGIL